MCDAYDRRISEYQTKDQRRRIWNLAGGWHCSIVGTCLTLGDLRALAKKLPLKVKRDYPLDYQYHGFFVRESATPNKASKMLNKLLDRRHATAIRKVRPLKTGCALEQHWEEALEAGDIPGPYWAILSHPYVTLELSERMFADVHMLSHLVGASNRADIRKIGDMEERNAEIRGKLSKQQRRHIERLDAKDREIASLRDELATLRSRISILDQAHSKVDELETACTMIPAMQGELKRLRDRAEQHVHEMDEEKTRKRALIDLIETLRQENKALEGVLLREELPEETAPPLKLDGCRILYVGGRPQTAHRLRTLVQGWDGELIHHDGGMEKSMNELAGALVTVDAVIFPTDCISHEAVKTIKRLCRQLMKPYAPVRSSGVASFVAGLRQVPISRQTSAATAAE